jgi:hypothetical protein
MTGDNQVEQLRATLHAMAEDVSCENDLYGRVADARGRRARINRVAIIAAPIAVVAIAALADVTNLGTRHTPPSVVVPAAPAAPHGSAACPTLGGPLDLLNIWRGTTMVDPHPTKIIVCVYSGSSFSNASVPHPIISFTGSAAASMAKRVNTAPVADPLMRCPMTLRGEIWIFLKATSLESRLWVQIGGCGTGRDGRRTIRIPSITHK